MAHVIFEIETASLDVETIVRYRKPPLRLGDGCVQKPLGSGFARCRMPSYDIFGADIVESSDVKGLMNSGDSVNDKAKLAEEDAGLMFMDIRPPT